MNDILKIKIYVSQNITVIENLKIHKEILHVQYSIQDIHKEGTFL